MAPANRRQSVPEAMKQETVVFEVRGTDVRIKQKAHPAYLSGWRMRFNSSNISSIVYSSSASEPAERRMPSPAIRFGSRSLIARRAPTTSPSSPRLLRANSLTTSYFARWIAGTSHQPRVGPVFARLLFALTNDEREVLLRGGADVVADVELEGVSAGRQ